MPVRLTINGQTTEAPAGETSLFHIAGSLGVQVPTSCITNGKCKECMVEVVEGMELLSPPTPAEAHLRGNFRLSCQTRIAADAGEVKCHTMRRGQLRIERHAYGLPAAGSVPLEPAVTRDGDRILIDGEEVERSTGPIHGIAMDLGTTTIVLRLFDLETGELIADTSLENPQRFGGSDVMSRIAWDTDHRGHLLMRTVAGYVSHAIESFPVDPKTIYEMVVVGNSTMRDIFFRQNVYSIGQNPYRSITEIEMAEGKRASTVLVDTGRRRLLPIHPKARVYGGPIVSGHVGADAAACMLAVDLAHEERLVAIMDIGTNTELILGNRHRILAASCPAGPAFEGGAIACGMPGLEGAIEDVRIRDDGSFEIGVIGHGEDGANGADGADRANGADAAHGANGANGANAANAAAVAPQGICGSGLVDVLSELLRTGRMNVMGRFEEGHRPIFLDPAGEVYFTESDANELAQAKGANAAGLQVVCSEYGIGFDDVQVFYLAGGFGRHLDTEAARRIGLIPQIPDDRIVQVGNAAIEGASIALLSVSRRQELERLVAEVRHVRLETHPQFFDFFVEGCQFKPIEALARAEPQVTG